MAAGVVATPMTSGANKEDVGKGGASPAPIPKSLRPIPKKADDAKNPLRVGGITSGFDFREV